MQNPCKAEKRLIKRAIKLNSRLNQLKNITQLCYDINYNRCVLFSKH